MYHSDIIQDMEGQLSMAKKRKDFHYISYYEYLIGRLEMCERFYIGDIDNAIASCGLEKIKKKFRDEGAVGDIWPMPFPITYISFDLKPRDVEPGKHGFTKGAVVCTTPPEEAKKIGYVFAIDSFNYINGSAYGKGMAGQRIWTPDGYSIIQTESGFGCIDPVTGDYFPTEDTEKYAKENNMHLAARSILSLLLSCKNIVPEDIQPSAAMNRKRVRRGERPVLSYKVLKVKKIGAKHNGGYGKGDGLNALHLCRGHFKNFTEDKPLFGRFTGMYWWEPQVRGNRKRGMIKKRYELDPEDFTT